MDSVLDFITAMTTWLADQFFVALSFFSPVVVLWIISALTGVLMLLVWRYTSNQEAIADVRRKIAANLLATRLFKDSLAVTFRAQRQIIWQSIRLLGYSFKPMLIMLIPFVLIMVQIGLRYEFRPVGVGETVRVTATVKNDIPFNGPESQLSLPNGLRHNPQDPCRAEPIRTVDWRLMSDTPGTFELSFGENAISVPLIIDGTLPRIDSLRGGGFFDRLLYSSQPSIPTGSIFESIRIHYPTRSTPIFGFDVHWLITLFVLSIVFALLFKPILKVHI